MMCAYFSLYFFLFVFVCEMNFVEDYESDNEIFQQPQIILKPQLLSTSSNSNTSFSSSSFPSNSTLNSSSHTSTLSTSLIPSIQIISSSSLSTNKNKNLNLLQLQQKEILNNPSIDIVLAPSQGPLHPYRFNQTNSNNSKQIGMGQIENALVDDTIFDLQYQTYLKSGYAIDINTNQILGDINAYHNSNNDSLTNISNKKVNTNKQKRKREEEEVVELENEEDGPWIAMPKEEEEEENNEEEEGINSNIEKKNDQQTLESLEVPIPLEVTIRSKVSQKKILQKNSGKNVKEDNKEDIEEKIEGNNNNDRGVGGDLSDQVIPSNIHIVEPDEEAEKWERVNERKMTFTLPPRPARGSFIGEVSIIFSYLFANSSNDNFID